MNCGKDLTLKVAERINGMLNIFWTKRSRDKPGLKRRGWKVNTVFQHMMKQPFERIIIALRRGREINNFTFAKVYAHHRAYLIYSKRDSRFRQRLDYCGFQLFCFCFEFFVDQGIFHEDRKCDITSSHGQW